MFPNASWKVWVTILVAATALAFGVQRYRSTFGPSEPAALELRKHHSERIEGPLHHSAAWRQFQQLAGTTRVAAELQRAGEYSVALAEIAGNGSDAVWWQGDTARTHGFEPLASVEGILLATVRLRVPLVTWSSANLASTNYTPLSVTFALP
jgi:hypothetical protein